MDCGRKVFPAGSAMAGIVVLLVLAAAFPHGAAGATKPRAGPDNLWQEYPLVQTPRSTRARAAVLKPSTRSTSPAPPVSSPRPGSASDRVAFASRSEGTDSFVLVGALVLLGGLVLALAVPAHAVVARFQRGGAYPVGGASPIVPLRAPLSRLPRPRLPSFGRRGGSNWPSPPEFRRAFLRHAMIAAAVLAVGFGLSLLMS